MTDATLKPPARFSHGLLLCLVVAIAVGLSSTVRQRSTMVFAFVTLALFLGGFWAFSRRGWGFTAVGTVLVQLGSVGLLLTTAWVFVQASGAPSAGGFLLSAAVVLALLGAVVAVVGALVPASVIDQDGPTIVALLYGGGIAAGIAGAVVTVQLGVASLFGTSAPSLFGTVRDLLLVWATVNPVTRAGSVALLAGGSLWYAMRLARLPLAQRVSRGLGRRWAIARERGLLQSGAAGDTADPRSGDGPSTRGPSRADRSTISERLGIGSRWGPAIRLTGVATFYLGGAALVLGHAPELQPIATSHPVPRAVDSVLGGSPAPQRLLGGVVVALFGLHLGHALAWRGIHVDWSASGRRLGYVAGSVVLVLGAGLVGGPLANLFLATPALQFVPMGEAGPVILATDAGVRLSESGLTGFEIQTRPAVFEPWFGDLVGLVGPPAFGIGSFAVTVVTGTLVLVVSSLGAMSARLTRPGTGIGLLFFAAAGAAVLGAEAVVALAAGAGALLAWELYSHGGSLHDTLDPGASTLTVEFVHLGASVVLVGLAAAVTVLGAQAIRFVPTPDAQWQVFGALALSLLALLLGLLYLGLRSHRP